VSQINLSYISTIKKDAKTGMNSFDSATLKFNSKSSVYGCSTKQMYDEKSKFGSSYRMMNVEIGF